MQKVRAAIVVVGALALAGCRPAGELLDGARGGRYVGVGIYSPGQSWANIVEANASQDKALARRTDDQVVIVVQDGRTGEIRACGDVSGYCIGMNPWSKPPSQRAPIKLVAHQSASGEPGTMAQSDAAPDSSVAAAPAANAN